MLEKFAAIQMLDVHFPTTDGRELIFCRYTQPEKDQKMIWRNWAGNCRRSPRRESPAKGNCPKTELGADLWNRGLIPATCALSPPVAKVGLHRINRIEFCNLLILPKPKRFNTRA